ncbi:MAG: hypothetical protein ACJ0DJ_11750 [bacterium]
MLVTYVSVTVTFSETVFVDNASGTTSTDPGCWRSKQPGTAGYASGSGSY